MVGLTDVNPTKSNPVLFDYTLCAQYPGAVPSAATVTLHCRDNVPEHRYVIVQFPNTTVFNICEVQVLVEKPGMSKIIRPTARDIVA